MEQYQPMNNYQQTPYNYPQYNNAPPQYNAFPYPPPQNPQYGAPPMVNNPNFAINNHIVNHPIQETVVVVTGGGGGGFHCVQCQKNVPTQIVHRMGNYAWTCFILGFLTCPCLICYAIFSDDPKDKYINCGYCGNRMQVIQRQC